MVFTIKYRVFLFCKFSHHPILWVKLQKPLVKFSVTACCSPRLKLTACTENSPWKFTWRPGVWRVSSTNKQIIDDYCIYIYENGITYIYVCIHVYIYTYIYIHILQ
jgi:hypothetical protein